MSERIDINDRSIPGHVRRRLTQAAQWRQTQTKKYSDETIISLKVDPTEDRPSFSDYEGRIARVAMMTGTDVSGVVHRVAKHWKSSEWNEPSASGREGD